MVRNVRGGTGAFTCGAGNGGGANGCGEHEIDQLRKALDEAWWNEAPLEQIQELETRIEEIRNRRGRETVRPAGMTKLNHGTIVPSS